MVPARRRCLKSTLGKHHVINETITTAFLSVESTKDGGSSEVVKLDLNGNILATYCFSRMMLHDVAIATAGVGFAGGDQCSRILGVGTLLASSDGLQPSKGRAEKRIIGKISIYELCETLGIKLTVLGSV
jgi:hypothetical protein